MIERIFCFTCKTKTETRDLHNESSKNKRLMMKGVCFICGTKKSMFILNKKGEGLADTIINKMPEMHLPFHRFTGPFTKLENRLDENDNPLPHSIPYNQVDEISRLHDICYRDTPKFKDKNKICDKQMLDRLKPLKTKGAREWLDRRAVKNIIGAKHTLGLGTN